MANSRCETGRRRHRARVRRGVCVPGAAMTVDAGGDPDMIGQAMRPGQLEKPELELTNMMWRRRRHDHEGTPCLLLLGTCWAFYGAYASRSIVSVMQCCDGPVSET